MTSIADEIRVLSALERGPQTRARLERCVHVKHVLDELLRTLRDEQLIACVHIDGEHYWYSRLARGDNR